MQVLRTENRLKQTANQSKRRIEEIKLHNERRTHKVQTHKHTHEMEERERY